MPTAAANVNRTRPPWRWLGVGLALIAIVVAWLLLPLDAWFKAFNHWVQDLGAVGALIFACVYVLATVLLLPASPLSIAAGLAFGLAWGFLLVSVSATAGAAAAFLVARYLARHHVEKMMQHRPRFKAVDRAISEDGWKVVVLLRLSPLVPFNLQNYFYGLTDIRFWHYVAATFFGILPGVLLYVYIGAAGRAVTAGGFGGTAKWALFAAGLIATVIVTVLVTRKARARLRDAGVEQES
ncbi:MAG: TVP38/TMEM64 family protein [Gammaproteobacteria bacterium]